jgi:hypothetical protein
VSGFNLPAIYCPIPPAIHPQWQVFQEKTNTWVAKHGMNAGRADVDRLSRIGSGELAGRTNPNATDTKAVQFASDMLMWLFAFDDAYCDEGTYSHDPGLLAILVADLIRVAECGHASYSFPLAVGLRDLRFRLDALASKVSTERWVTSFRAYWFSISLQ